MEGLKEFRTEGRQTVGVGGEMQRLALEISILGMLDEEKMP